MNSKNDGPLGPEIIIVLGAGVTADGQPSERTIARVNEAAVLARTIPDVTIIVSGDGRTAANKRKRSQTEASAMTRLLLAMNRFPKESILPEHQARDTMGNIILSAARYLIGKPPRKIHLVTSPFHGARALTMARGVLGDQWPIELHVCAVCEGDEPKGRNEAGGIEWAKRFFETTTPGDITSQIDRLLAVGKPAYRSMRWLVALASKKAA